MKNMRYENFFVIVTCYVFYEASYMLCFGYAKIGTFLNS